MRFYRKRGSIGDVSPPSSMDSPPEKRYPYETAHTQRGDEALYDEDLHIPQLDTKSERRLVTKIDLRVIPTLTILYLLAFLDRVNISNAVTFGLQKDLKLTGTEFNTALTIFFVPYVVFEIPANLLLKRLRPHIWLSSCMFLFGLVSICQGLVKNYSGLLATRFFLGLAETGMFPGCFYLIGMWYRREQAQKRFSFFFSSATLAGAFGGLLASAIGKMDGLRGYHGWRWIFILEGVLTCVVAIVWFFVISDFPEDAKWLSEQERSYIRARLQADVGKAAVERPTNFGDIVTFFKDYKVILGWLMYLGLIVPAYGYAYFSPTIIKTYGYSNIQTQLHSVPPWAAAWVMALILAFVSDTVKHRLGFALFGIILCVVGLSMLISIHHDLHTGYAALFLTVLGAYSAMPIVVCWFNQNLAGHHRRAIGTGWQIGMGNIGGIISTFVFLSKDAPRYTRGYAVCLGFTSLSFLASVLYAFACWSQNKKRSSMPTPMGTEAEEAEKGDMAQGYRYLL